MHILLAFAPFIAFALVDRAVGPVEGLIAGAVVSAGLTVREILAGRRPKILEVGTLVLFAGLAFYALVGAPGWSIMDVRLRVDLGLLAIVLLTLAIGRPFTLQYAREQVAPEHWDSPGFKRTNVVITAVWALAFAILVLADLVLIYMPDVHPRVGIIATVLALLGAAKFTGWYPKQVAARP